MGDLAERLQALACKFGMAYEDAELIEEVIALLARIDASPTTRMPDGQRVALLRVGEGSNG